MKNISRSVRLAAASLLILTGCAGARAPAPADAPPPPQIQQDNSNGALWQRIVDANADLGCDNGSQCHSIGVGSRACGGPENYLAWSSKNSDGAQLKALVAEHAASRREEDQRQGMVSVCSLISDPGASCRAGKCVLNGTSSASPGQPTSK